MIYVELISSTFRNIRHGVTPTSPGTCMLFVVGHWIFSTAAPTHREETKKRTLLYPSYPTKKTSLEMIPTRRCIVQLRPSNATPPKIRIPRKLFQQRTPQALPKSYGFHLSQQRSPQAPPKFDGFQLSQQRLRQRQKRHPTRQRTPVRRQNVY